MILTEKLRDKMNSIVDIYPYITKCSLDIICETTMGVKISAQNNQNLEYFNAINFLGESFSYRALNPTGWFDSIFYRTPYGKQYLEQLQKVQHFTRQVINDRKNEMQHKVSNLTLSGKRSLAFLDLLLKHNLLLKELTDENIREEVDTFMFEGNHLIEMCNFLI